MDDKTMMTAVLGNVKGMCDLMMHGAVESATPNVHAAFKTAFDETLAMQNEVYNKMAAKGWYPTASAEQKQIDAVKQKFSAGC